MNFFSLRIFYKLERQWNHLEDLKDLIECQYSDTNFTTIMLNLRKILSRPVSVEQENWKKIADMELQIRGELRLIWSFAKNEDRFNILREVLQTFIMLIEYKFILLGISIFVFITITHWISYRGELSSWRALGGNFPANRYSSIRHLLYFMLACTKIRLF